MVHKVYCVLRLSCLDWEIQLAKFKRPRTRVRARHTLYWETPREIYYFYFHFFPFRLPCVLFQHASSWMRQKQISVIIDYFYWSCCGFTRLFVSWDIICWFAKRGKQKTGSQCWHDILFQHRQGNEWVWTVTLQSNVRLTYITIQHKCPLSNLLRCYWRENLPYVSAEWKSHRGLWITAYHLI